MPVTEARPRARRKARPVEGNNDLLLAAVTALLKSLLENGLVERGVTANLGLDAMISALPPDRVTTGEEERTQLNLFLYDVRPKGLDAPGRYARAAGVAVPAVSLDFELSYLITAYGAQDFHIEVLLGYALEMLRDHAILPGERIRPMLASLGATEGGRVVLPGLASLGCSELAQRLEQIKISPQVQNPDESSRLWSSLQARFRPSALYKVAVYLRDGDGEPGEHG